MTKGRASTKRNKTKARAWLITWENMKPNKAASIVSIIDPRRSPTYVSEVMRELYVAEHYSPGEKLYFARYPKERPEARNTTQNGVPRGDIFSFFDAGGDKWLYGRLVSNLSVSIEASSVETTRWNEPDELEWESRKKVKARVKKPGIQRSLERSIG